jgi:hypothetical protein
MRMKATLLYRDIMLELGREPIGVRLLWPGAAQLFAIQACKKLVAPEDEPSCWASTSALVRNWALEATTIAARIVRQRQDAPWSWRCHRVLKDREKPRKVRID